MAERTAGLDEVEKVFRWDFGKDVQEDLGGKIREDFADCAVECVSSHSRGLGWMTFVFGCSGKKMVGRWNPMTWVRE